MDPSDPLVQQLVQDRNFLTAVQTSQLHTAACAAVRLLRVRPRDGLRTAAGEAACMRMCMKCSEQLQRELLRL